MTLFQKTEARRFITLIDTLYDNRVRHVTRGRLLLVIAREGGDARGELARLLPRARAPVQLALITPVSDSLSC